MVWYGAVRCAESWWLMSAIRCKYLSWFTIRCAMEYATPSTHSHSLPLLLPPFPRALCTPISQMRGDTALNIAAKEGHKASVQALINAKANLEAKDKVGDVV